MHADKVIAFVHQDDQPRPVIISWVCRQHTSWHKCDPVCNTAINSEEIKLILCLCYIPSYSDLQYSDLSGCCPSMPCCVLVKMGLNNLSWINKQTFMQSKMYLLEPFVFFNWHKQSTIFSVVILTAQFDFGLGPWLCPHSTSGRDTHPISTRDGAAHSKVMIFERDFERRTKGFCIVFCWSMLFFRGHGFPPPAGSQWTMSNPA